MTISNPQSVAELTFTMPHAYVILQGVIFATCHLTRCHLGG